MMVFEMTKCAKEQIINGKHAWGTPTVRKTEDVVGGLYLECLKVISVPDTGKIVSGFQISWMRCDRSKVGCRYCNDGRNSIHNNKKAYG